MINTPLEIVMQYFGSNQADTSAVRKQAGFQILSVPALDGHQWYRKLRRSTDTGGPLAYSGNQRFYFDT